MTKLCALIFAAGIMTASASQAAQADFQYGLIRTTVRCLPVGGYGQTTKFFLYSHVVTYCPYGPQPDWNGDAESAIEQAIQVVCGGGEVRRDPASPWDGAMSEDNAQARFNEAANCTSAFWKYDGCELIAWIPTFYSTYNNPVNCHP